MALCPHCNDSINDVEVEGITLTAANMNTWRGLSYACSHCHRVLSVGVDPTAQENDIVQSVVAALRKG
jgi:hypothetical protein